MDQDQAIRFALSYLREKGIDGDVLSYHVYAERVSLVLDRGVKGCPKYTIALSDLAEIVELKQVKPLSEVNATDAAFNLAGDNNIDLRTIEGTGRNGRILLSDVREAIDANTTI